MKKICCFFVLTLLVLSSCKDDDTEKSYVFEGVFLFDENGNGIGCHGECDDDWTFQSISDKEKEVLDFHDTIPSERLDRDVSVSLIGGFPVPLPRNGNMFMFLRSEGAVILKLAVVDKNLHVMNRLIYEAERGYNQFVISGLLFKDIEPVTTHRIYYGVYDKNGANDQYGFADFSICPDGVGSADYLNCLE